MAGNDNYFNLPTPGFETLGKSSNPFMENLLNPGSSNEGLSLGGNQSGGMFDIGNFFGEGKGLGLNMDTMGLAGGLYSLYGDSQKRKEARRVNDFNMDMKRKQLGMTQKAYNNDMYRSNMLEAQQGGPRSQEFSQARQYVGPANTQPGYQAQPAPQATPAPYSNGLANTKPKL